MEWKNINKSDTILIQANVAWTLKKHRCTVSDILKSFLEAAGTVVFPTFNIGFAEGIPFDIRTTQSDMGVLSESARKHKDAVRSGHPMYSFVAIGKEADRFNVNNFSGYDKNSPFAILRRLNGKIGVLGLPDSEGNTMHHHAEEMNRVSYRSYKNFTGSYTDKYGNTDIRTYSFFCRDLRNTTILDPTMEMMWEAGLYKGCRPFEGDGFRVIGANDMFDFVSNIIKTGQAEGLLYRRKV